MRWFLYSENGENGMSADPLVDLVLELNGSLPPPPLAETDPPVFPPYLRPKYWREIAAHELRAYLPTSELARGALLRAAMLDSEEDVRKAAIVGLFHARCSCLESVLNAAALDVDDGVRQLALECLTNMNAASKAAVAKILTADPDPDVAALAADILGDRQIWYSYLVGP
jgi:hypothetical protein